MGRQDVQQQQAVSGNFPNLFFRRDPLFSWVTPVPVRKQDEH